MNFGFDFSQLLWLLLSLLFPVAILLMLRKNRRKRESLFKDETSASGPLVEDPDALRRAEDAVHKGTPLQVREDLLVTHSLVERFQTMRGFSEEYMIDLTQTLAQENISAIYLFQETLPLGYASVSNAQGVYELYVPQGEETRARELIKFKMSED